ncbi:DUF4037 domain-containing protein [Halobacillus litoralis]|uniref:DUF4037 domain-containing protein n=1 Tax=Halobacillus litoralis TaxID=45668 RepID=UPI001369A231|nr:DUF4037 domain-containing protein [Halobacillus litoralis]MYL36935.1 DUF4037 domain-containing protein [Halobacillus litoralis]
MCLYDKAVKMAACYQENQKVEAVILAGSVSRKVDDHHSDVELHVLWKEPPKDQDRMDPVNKGKNTLHTFYPYEDGEWSETYRDKNGVKFEISSFLTTTITEVTADVKEKLDTSYEKQCLLAAIQDGEALYGHPLVGRLKQDLAVYPHALAEKMILEHMDFGSPWNSRKALLEREDWLMYYSVICQVHRHLFGILHGLNRLYVKHPSFKWMSDTLQQMPAAPDQMAERVTHVFQGTPVQALQETEILVEEVIRLVEACGFKNAPAAGAGSSAEGSIFYNHEKSMGKA